MRVALPAGGGYPAASSTPPESVARREKRLRPHGRIEPVARGRADRSGPHLRLRHRVVHQETCERVGQTRLLRAEHAGSMGRALFIRTSRIKMLTSAEISTSSPSEETASETEWKNVEVG